MKYSSRFFLYAPLALFLAIASFVGVGWWIEASALSRRLDALNGRAAMPGVTLSFSTKRIAGFPFNLDVEFRDFRVVVATGHGPASWTADRFALHALTYGREQMLFEAAGKQLLTWNDLYGHRRALPFEIGEWHASAITDDHGLARFDMALIGLGSPALTAGKVELHVRLNPSGTAIDIAAAADAVRLSPALASSFGAMLTQIRLNAAATPARSFVTLRAAQARWEDSLDSWRRAGGVLHVADLELRWERLSALGKGTLSLDDSHAVQGLLDFKVAGSTALLDAAARQHVSAGANRGISAALLTRAAQAGSNAAGLLGAVLVFHHRVVSVGDEPATTEEPLY